VEKLSQIVDVLIVVALQHECLMLLIIKI